MKEPIHWQARENTPEQTTESQNTSWLAEIIKLIICVSFLIVSFLWWKSAGHFNWLFYLILLIPSWICSEYIFGKLAKKYSGLSTSESGFSIVRILYGLLIAILLLGVVYILLS